MKMMCTFFSLLLFNFVALPSGYSKTLPPQVPREIECAVSYNPPTYEYPPDDDQNKHFNTVEESSSQTGDCKCVPYYLCNKNRTISQDGQGLLYIRSPFLSGVGLVSMPPYSPCPCNKATSDPKPTGSGVCSNYLDVCCTLPSQAFIKESTLECGRQRVGGFNKRITDGGGEVRNGEFPWMVTVLGDRIAEGGVQQPLYLCGGSLIHPRVVLTAAHCVKGVSGLVIRSGEWGPQATINANEVQERTVGRAVIHENYYAGTLFNDIALLFLESAVHLTPHIGIVCLPPQGEVEINQTCVASGWGQNVFDEEGKYKSTLRKVELPLVSRNLCERELRKTRLGIYFRLHRSFLCAGGQPRQDTCKGDGGSPLVCLSTNDDSVYTQTGIVSWGIGCGGKIPGIYTSVSHFRNWIDDKIAILSIDDRFGVLERR